MPVRPRIVLSLAALLVLGGAASACRKASEPEPEPPKRRVENAALGVAIMDLPAAFEVAKSDDSGLVLETQDGGRLDFVLGEVENSINLVQAARDHEASFEGRPEGELKQRTEMMSGDFGTVYFSRGRYQAEAGGLEEEAVLLFIHPWGDRQLTLRYVYPVTGAPDEDLKPRIEDHLFAAFGELEGLPMPSAEPSAEGGDGSG